MSGQKRENREENRTEDRQSGQRTEASGQEKRGQRTENIGECIIREFLTDYNCHQYYPFQSIWAKHAICTIYSTCYITRTWKQYGRDMTAGPDC